MVLWFAAKGSPKCVADVMNYFKLISNHCFYSESKTSHSEKESYVEYTFDSFPSIPTPRRTFRSIELNTPKGVIKIDLLDAIVTQMPDGKTYIGGFHYDYLDDSKKTSNVTS